MCCEQCASRIVHNTCIVVCGTGAWRLFHTLQYNRRAPQAQASARDGKQAGSKDYSSKLEEYCHVKRSPLLDRYEHLVGKDVLSRVYQAAESLAGLHVLHINTTARGGGVAELLGALIPLMDELGMKHT